MSTEEEIVPPIVDPADAKKPFETITVKVGDVEAYQQRMQAVNARQREAIDRLLTRISQLEAINARDADTIAGMDTRLGDAIEELRATNVLLEQARGERDDAFQALAGIAEYVSSKTLTIDGTKINPLATPDNSSYTTAADVIPDLDPADEERLAIAEATLESIRNEVDGEEKPGKHLRA